jgi:SET domain-containing protein
MENNFLKIKKSLVHGNGIFTEKNIIKGEIFYTVPVEKLSSYPVKRWAKINNNKWVCDGNVLNFVNHSCEPNTKLDISKEQPFLIALENIKNGDEITVNYDLTETEGNRIFCECKRPNCKGYFLRVN